MSPGKRSLLLRRKTIDVNKLLKLGSMSLDVEGGEEDGEPEEFEEKPKVSCCKKWCSLSCLKGVKSYMSESSLFIFHSSCKIRQLCLKLLSNPASKKNGLKRQGSGGESTSMEGT